jgi:predicted NBD/HSP70 family sugar kinase
MPLFCCCQAELANFPRDRPKVALLPTEVAPSTLQSVHAANVRWRDGRGAGAVLALVRREPGVSRATLVERTGLSRSAVSDRLEQLLAQDLVVNAEGESTGGRRPSVFRFNPRAGVVLAAGIGATHTRLGVADLSGAMLADHAADHDVGEGPESTFTWIEQRFDDLLAEAGVDHRRVWGIGVAIPAPVESAAGAPVLPPIMPGWDAYPIPKRLAPYGVPVQVDNDVNAMALGEQRTHYPDIANLLFLKIGTGIGCGIIADHNVYRGADGSAGDLGHVHTGAARDALCRCGKFGCLEAVASGGAIARRLREQGVAATTTRDVVELVRAGDMRAIELVREAGRLIGEALAGAVNLLNPRVIVIGGDLAHVEEHLMPGIRELVYQRSLSLATRQLRIARSRLDDFAEVTGAAMMAVDRVLSPQRVDELVEA